MKTLKSLFVITLAASICFTLTACDSRNNSDGTYGGGGGGGSGNFNGKTITSYETGTNEGYDYEFWSNNNVSGSMTLGSGGTFKCEWTKKSGTNNGNILFRSGKRFGSTQTYDKYGDISIKYAANYNPKSGGVSYLSVYGWLYSGNSSNTANMVEYYIVDNYLDGYHPGKGQGSEKKGSFSIDGETYEVYTHSMSNAPAIAGSGNYNFNQYISVRTSKRTSGTISVSKHFAKWKELGLNMDANLYEVMMKVEGYDSSGSAEITENILTTTK